MTYNFINTD